MAGFQQYRIVAYIVHMRCAATNLMTTVQWQLTSCGHIGTAGRTSACVMSRADVNCQKSSGLMTDVMAGLSSIADAPSLKYQPRSSCAQAAQRTLC
jgi:hypothetical protein